MKALRFSRFGPPSVLAIEEVPRPKSGPGEALIQVQAAAINPSGVKNVSGLFKGTTLPRPGGSGFPPPASWAESSSTPRWGGCLTSRLRLHRSKPETI
jgi:NADPH2:quinone reductase